MNITSIKLIIKQKIPIFVKLTRKFRFFSKVLLKMLDEFIFCLTFKKGIRKRIRPDFCLYVHPLAFRISYSAFINTIVRDELNNFINYCNKGMHFVDIGSQFGIFSFTALNYGAEKVVSFEPSSFCCKIMNLIKKSNKIPDEKLKIINMAIGKKRMCFYFKTME